jgi:hypothetical protein
MSYNFQIEQVAIAVPSRDEAIAEYVKQRHLHWVTDTVSAEGRIRYPTAAGSARWSDCVFTVNLGFNYSVIPDKEFELIECIDGHSIQFVGHSRLFTPFMSHMAFHGKVGKYLDDPRLVMDVKTVHHTGTPRRYRYIFLDHRYTLGCYIKVIERLNPEETAPKPQGV